MSDKLCKDCKWCDQVGEPAVWVCNRPLGHTISLVDGSKRPEMIEVADVYRLCDWQRHSGALDECGYRGRFFDSRWLP